MTKLTNTELALLEQLTYLNDKVGDKAGIKLERKRGFTIGRFLEQFDEKALKRLENATKEKDGKTVEYKDGVYVSGKEWAQIIRALKKSRMKDFVISDIKEKKTNWYDEKEMKEYVMCFTEKGIKDHAYVSFRGTCGDDEWEDNMKGLNMADTPLEIEAYNYVNSLPYKKVTLTGHSKGGNKAMYVAIRSDKVIRCVALDAQGFSKEFVDAHGSLILKNGGKITNYAIDADFVHLLLFQLETANLKYAAQNGVDSTPELHSPNTFFTFDENGNPIMILKNEDEAIKLAHNFTIFLANNASADDKQQIVDLLGSLVPRLMNGCDKAMKEAWEYICDNPYQIALFLAYIIKFAEVNNVNSKQVEALLRALKLDKICDFIEFRLELGKAPQGVEAPAIKFSIFQRLMDFIDKHVNDNKLSFRPSLTEAILQYFTGKKIKFDEICRMTEIALKTIKITNNCKEAKAHPSAKGASGSGCIEVDTYLLRECADILKKANDGLKKIDEDIESLYNRTGLTGLKELVEEDFYPDTNNKLSSYVEFLRNSANAFDDAERQIQLMAQELRSDVAKITSKSTTVKISSNAKLFK